MTFSLRSMRKRWKLWTILSCHMSMKSHVHFCVQCIWFLARWSQLPFILTIPKPLTISYYIHQGHQGLQGRANDFKSGQAQKGTVEKKGHLYKGKSQMSKIYPKMISIFFSLYTPYNILLLGMMVWKFNCERAKRGTVPPPPRSPGGPPLIYIIST